MVNLRGKPPSPDHFNFHFRFFYFHAFFPRKLSKQRLLHSPPSPSELSWIPALNCTWSEEVICLDIRSRNINYAWTKAPTSAALHGRYPLMVINLHKSHWWSLPRDLLLITWGMYWWLGVWWWWKIKCGLPQEGYLHIRNFSLHKGFSKVENSYLHIRNFSHLTISELNSVKTLSLMTNSLVVPIPTNRRQISYLTFLDHPPPPTLQTIKHTTHVRKCVLFPDPFKSFLLGHWYPCFGLLVTSAMALKPGLIPHLHTSSFVCNGFCWSIDSLTFNLGLLSKSRVDTCNFDTDS